MNKRQLLLQKINRGAKVKIYGDDEILTVDYVSGQDIYFQDNGKNGGGFTTIYAIEAVELMIDVEKYIESVDYSTIKEVTR